MKNPVVTHTPKLAVTMTEPLAETVDSLAAVQAQIKTLEAEEKVLKQELIDSLQSTIRGSLHKAVVKYVPASEVIDYKAVCDFVEMPPRILEKFKKPKAGYSSVTIYGA